MRILMSTWGWRSHFYSLVPLAWGLRAAGHEVLVASHPSMTGVITGAGLAAVPLGADVDFASVFSGRIGKVGRFEANGDDGSLEPRISPDGGVVRMADALLDDLVAFGRSYRPDLVVWEPFNLAAPIAAAALGVPGVLALWGPDYTVSLRLDTEAVVGPLANRFGLAASEVSLTGTMMLDPVPPPMQVPLAGPSRPIRYVPYNGTAVLPAWLHEPPARPRVCVTGGTVAGPGLSERTELTEVIRGVAELDVEVVVAVMPAHRETLGPLPDNVRVPDSPIALRLVLPTCAAFVQHGGAGTIMTALVYGVPQLILPQITDEHFNAERLAATGAGTWLDNPDAATVRDTVGTLAGDGPWRAAAGLMRDRIHAMPAPAEVAGSLAELVEAEGARA
ncbi:nucleotide disphospho-sugar-binding domain-containing protein [Actinophytocola sp.]|uniref:nucleotide disphospho-sugar-binding domain-containing protein n=1 Tax=Actinophytocola sp. TaxID=1872138 RepID=UPI002D80F9B3|nr:nucleotide disphospho-sugar-binding domain-containing protein [Actinophytocola sp.]HET9143127.1 nucleotide disphospho-sugar-binding domain-containing protein [Actinophytocola sp.]